MCTTQLRIILSEFDFGHYSYASVGQDIKKKSFQLKNFSMLGKLNDFFI